MIVELKSIQDAFKTASSISKTILGFKIAVEVKNEILNLMNSLIEAQSETLSIQEKIGELEREKNFALAELDRISRWQEEERQKYEMCQITPGQIVYRYIDSNEPRHFICPECFRNNIKSLMNNPAGVGAAAKACTT